MHRLYPLKTATAEASRAAARNFAPPVLRDVGLPDVLVSDRDRDVSDRDTRFASAFWAGLHAALGSSLVFGSPH
jgi:hypothetical protein